MTKKSFEQTRQIDPSNPPTPKFGMYIEGQQDGATENAKPIAAGTASYEYDVWNQLIKASTGEGTSTYKYNGEGYRTEKTENGVLTRSLYEADKVILETDKNGKETARNIYGTNLISRTVTTTENGTTQKDQYNYMYNGHADVTALLTADGTIAASYYYDAFGTAIEKNENKGINNPYRYSGYVFDNSTNLYYLNARYYDSKIARFMSEDTYTGTDSDPLSLNLYTYCVNNPIMYTDPTGHNFIRVGVPQKNDHKKANRRHKVQITVGDQIVKNTSNHDGQTSGNLMDIVTGLDGSVIKDDNGNITDIKLNNQTTGRDVNIKVDSTTGRATYIDDSNKTIAINLKPIDNNAYTVKLNDIIIACGINAENVTTYTSIMKSKKGTINVLVNPQGLVVKDAESEEALYTLANEAVGAENYYTISGGKLIVNPNKGTNIIKSQTAGIILDTAINTKNQIEFKTADDNKEMISTSTGFSPLLRSSSNATLDFGSRLEDRSSVIIFTLGDYNSKDGDIIKSNKKPNGERVKMARGPAFIHELTHSLDWIYGVYDNYVTNYSKEELTVGDNASFMMARLFREYGSYTEASAIWIQNIVSQELGYCKSEDPNWNKGYRMDGDRRTGFKGDGSYGEFPIKLPFTNINDFIKNYYK